MKNKKETLLKKIRTIEYISRPEPFGFTAMDPVARREVYRISQEIISQLEKKKGGKLTKDEE